MNKFFIGVIIGMFLGAGAYVYGQKSVEQPPKACYAAVEHPKKGTFEYEVKRTD